MYKKFGFKLRKLISISKKKASQSINSLKDLKDRMSDNSLDVMVKLRSLDKLKKDGIITQDEFEQMKKKILKQFD